MKGHAVSHPTHTVPDQRADDAQYYRHVLHGLIDLGADLAGLVHRQAVAQASAPASAPASAQASAPAASGEPAAAADATIAFDRIARTVRRTIALARRVAEPVPAPATARTGWRRTAARKHIIRAVEDAIGRSDGHAESLHAEFLDRLDGPDLDDDIDHRPVGDIIAEICRDLGIAAASGAQPYKRRTPADIAQLCALAARAEGKARRPSAPAKPQPAKSATNVTGSGADAASGSRPAPWPA